MGNHDMSDYLSRVMWALCENGVPALPVSAPTNHAKSNQSGEDRAAFVSPRKSEDE